LRIRQLIISRPVGVTRGGSKTRNPNIPIPLHFITRGPTKPPIIIFAGFEASTRPAKGAHDELVAAAHRAQADALEIEAGAKRRLADEYDAAQERGEVATVGKRSQLERLKEAPPSAADVGLSRKQVHEARIIRDADDDMPRIEALGDGFNAVGCFSVSAGPCVSDGEPRTFGNGGITF
jgi:hypothetical protein